MRIRIKFAKTAHMQYTGHLDLHRTIERTMRRANLPLTYSQGFSPKPKITLASALPLGYTSACELVDIWLDEDVDLMEIAQRFKAASPPGVQLLEMDAVDNRAPKLQNVMCASAFTVTLLENVPDLESRVADLVAQDSLPRQRKRKGKIKTYDLRPLIEELKVLSPDKEDRQRLHMCLTALPGATGRPDDVLDALGIDPYTVKTERTAIILADAPIPQT
jgi:radical SAM-linked protein